MKFTAKVTYISDRDGSTWNAKLVPGFRVESGLRYDDCNGWGNTPEEAVESLKGSMESVDDYADREIDFEYGPPRTQARED